MRLKLLLIVTLCFVLVLPALAQEEPDRLILATTTSTQDSGLLDYLIPYFEEAYAVEVDVIAVGTGQALELGANGDADVLLVHAKAREEAFVEAGDGVARLDVMYNDFVVVGTADDPAAIAELETANEAFTSLAESESLFISRGDESGTHTKELDLWAAAEIEPEGDWYIEAGQGMGEVLLMANELQAYTLTDRATFYAIQDELDLTILFEGDPGLFNQYGVIAVNPEKHPAVNAAMAQTFVDWITSLGAQELIAAFEIDGNTLFTPNSAAWLEAHPVEIEATPEPTPEVTAEPGS